MDAQKKKVVPVQDGMWREEDGKVYLLGTRCEVCGEEFFPRKEVHVCPHCQSDQLVDTEFLGEGKIITYTTVLYRPAGNFYLGPVPFHYVVVQLNHGAVNVQGHYLCEKEEDMHVGDWVKAVPGILWETGDEIVTCYKFAPIGKEA